jgi:hypothetical protein
VVSLKLQTDFYEVCFFVFALLKLVDALWVTRKMASREILTFAEDFSDDFSVLREVVFLELTQFVETHSNYQLRLLPLPQALSVQVFACLAVPCSSAPFQAPTLGPGCR